MHAHELLNHSEICAWGKKVFNHELFLNGICPGSGVQRAERLGGLLRTAGLLPLVCQIHFGPMVCLVAVSVLFQLLFY